MRERIIADIFVFCLFFWAPWQITAVAVIVFIILFENYLEGTVAALIADSFYSLPEISFWRGFGFFTLSSLLILYISSFAKSKIKIMALD